MIMPIDLPMELSFVPFPVIGLISNCRLPTFKALSFGNDHPSAKPVPAGIIGKKSTQPLTQNSFSTSGPMTRQSWYDW